MGVHHQLAWTAAAALGVAASPAIARFSPALASWPAPVSSLVRTQDRTEPPADSSANECRPTYGASSNESPGTLTFYGAVECRDPARLEGKVELLAPDGTPEASGPPFSVEGTTARSDGRHFPVTEGSQHELVYSLSITSLDGGTWDAEPNGACQGDGAELRCVFRRIITA